MVTWGFSVLLLIAGSMFIVDYIKTHESCHPAWRNVGGVMVILGFLDLFGGLFRIFVSLAS